MESAFGEHMIKCIILNDDNNDQFIIRMDFLALLHAILNFKDNYIEIQDIKLPLKVIAAVHPLTKLFLSAACDNLLEEIPEEERVTLPNNQVAMEFLIETAIVNITNGLMQWCKPFILQLATLSSPLYVLLRHNSNYKFTDNHKKAFNGIKQALTLSPFFRYPLYPGKAQFVIQTDASTTVMAAILYQESGDDKWDYNYKVEYVKGKDNACADFLSRKDDHEQPPIPSTEDLAAEIFCPQFLSCSGVSEANPMVTDILSVGISLPTLTKADVNAITYPMTKQPINQPTLSDPVFLAANYMQHPVKTITIATQEEIQHVQATDPIVTKIMETLQNADALKHPIVFFTEDGILYWQVKDLHQLVIPASLVDEMLHQFHGAKILFGIG
uniref:Reverse transcriptase/retrotransposon-derived protein RNase H-like domain-containing protein n=1 Tax=Romanomermis culicivorax TaxID=13658 RepID=A0A915IA74_ROMCU